MCVYICSLNSGSNGNCYYIGNDTEAVLIDAGLSCRETEKRMASLQLNMNKVKAVFISHEHTDHIKGVERLAEKYNIPIRITRNTFINGRINISKQLLQEFTAFEPILIGGLSITAFPKFHDAIDPHSFIINYMGINIGVFTDIGKPCSRLTNYFHQCHAAFLESNYDDVMLENGRYPIYLKNRIRGGNGHLSNSQALKVFIENRSPFMTHLFLSHLSQENNCPQLVERLFSNESGGTKIIIASRNQATAVYQITASSKPTVFVSTPVNSVLSAPSLLKPKQLSLF